MFCCGKTLLSNVARQQKSNCLIGRLKNYSISKPHGMIVTHGSMPTEEQFEKLLRSDITGPLCTVSLLKFREKAVYPDGRHSELTGAEAYSIYGNALTKHIKQQGGQIQFEGVAHGLLIGDVEELWDKVYIIVYASKEAYAAMFRKQSRSQEVQDMLVHRTAGLAGQLLLVTKATLPQYQAGLEEPGDANSLI